MKKALLITTALAVFGGVLLGSEEARYGWGLSVAPAYADDDDHDQDHKSKSDKADEEDDDGDRPPLPPLPPKGDGRMGFPPPFPPPDGMPPRPGWLLGKDVEDHDKARAALQAGEIVPLRVILEAVEADFEGQMLEAELEHRDSLAWYYELKVLAPDGNIFKLYYDAKKAELIKAKGHGLFRWYKGDQNALPPALAELKRRMDAHRGHDGEVVDEEGHSRGRGAWGGMHVPPQPYGALGPSMGPVDGPDGNPPPPAAEPSHAPTKPEKPKEPWYNRWISWVWE